MNQRTPIVFSEQVAEALAKGQAVVALESSVIAQGLPRPRNYDAALAAEGSVREGGAVPASTAIIDGLVRVGLEDSLLHRLAFEDDVEKGGARDLPRAVASGSTMATTVGSTLAIARISGIRVMATGGIGGVHRQWDETGDVSHDLHALAETPCVTVCAGIKSVLDVDRTMEYLETLGVPVIGYRTTCLPNFYSIDSGRVVPQADDASAVANMFRLHQVLGLNPGLLLVNPPPTEIAFSKDELDRLVDGALASARVKTVRGKAVTPYLLSHIAASSAGRSVQLNMALLASNARVAAEVSLALAAK